MSNLKLALLYKKETGRNIPQPDLFVDEENGQDYDVITEQYEDYVNWLEEKLCSYEKEW